MKPQPLSTVGLLWSVLVVAAVYGATAAQAAPVGSAFLYQGRLDLDGVAVHNTCDCRFSLWDAPAEGAQVGPTLTFSAEPGFPPPIEIIEGLFAVALDFGPDAFTDEARWLELAVRCPSDGDYTVLSPRQPLAAVPYSVQTRGIHVDQNRNVGIGTTAPEERLHLVRRGDSLLRLDDTVEGTGYWNVANAESESSPDLHGLRIIPDSSSEEEATVTFWNFGRIDSVGGMHVLNDQHDLAARLSGSVGGSLWLFPRDASGSASVTSDADSFSGGGGLSVYGALGAGSNRIHIRGEDSFSNPKSGSSIELRAESGASTIKFNGGVAPNNGVLAYVDGRVAIGRTAASHQLHVEGDRVHLSTSGNAGRFVTMRTDRGALDLTAQGGDLFIQSNSHDTVIQLVGVRFNMIGAPEVPEVGLVAQNVREVLPEAVGEVDPEHGYLGVSYPSLIPVLVEAVKELRAEKEAQLKEKDEQIAALTARLERVEGRLAANLE